MPTPKIFDASLGLLPNDFRAEYGAEIEGVVREQWEDVRHSMGGWKRLKFWTRQVVSIGRLALRLRLGFESSAISYRYRHATRTTRGWRMGGWGQDLRQAAKSLAKQPGFTLVTVLTLGLGIGASTAIFSAVHAVLLRDLAYADADRIVAVIHTDTESKVRSTGASAGNLRDLAESAAQLSGVSVAEPWSLDLLQDGRTQSLRTWNVAEGFFQVLGARALLGRTFLEEEYVEGNDRVVVLGFRSWTVRFGADPAVVGRTVTLDNEPYTVVGVLPNEFKYPDQAAAWIPRPPRASDDASRAADYLTGIARLAPGATLSEAQAETDRIARSLAEAHPETNATTGLQLIDFREHLFGDVRTPLIILLSAVGFVLLIACSNVAGLMLARGARREREFALRGALGAGRARLARYVATESLLLAGLGCALGVGLTVLGVGMIQTLGPDHLPRIDELRVDGVVLTYAVLVSGVSALVAGIVPALGLSRPDLQTVLSDGARGSTGGPAGIRLRNRLVVVEVAAALVLLIGAGLLTKSFTILVNEELGFEPTDRVAVQMFLNEYRAPGELSSFVAQTLENMDAIPGVTGVAITTNVPGATDGAIAGIDIDLPFRVEGRALSPTGREPVALTSQVSAGYFELMGIPTVQGRWFTPDDRPEAPPVVVVNEAFARRHLADTDVVGERLAVPWGNPGEDWLLREIVGVVRDVRPLGFGSEPQPEIYLPLEQVLSVSLTFILAVDREAEAAVQSAQEAVWKSYPGQSIWGATTLDTLLAERLKERRFNLMLLSAFAGIAVLLAAIGIYGLVSFSVAQRVGELGIRRALGGRTRDVLGMILRQGAVLAAAGVAVGVIGALALTRFLSGMLFGVEAVDWQTFAGLSLVVLLVSVLATLIPAVRATRVDPMNALRES